MANFKDKRKYFFIYKTTNLLNEKYYIGMHTTSNLKDGYLGSGTRLRKAIRKYGKHNFKCEILEFLSCKEELINKEKEIVTAELISDNLCTNLKLGGKGGFSREEAKLGRIATDKILKEKHGENFREVIMQRFFQNLSKDDKIKRSKNIIEGQNKINFNHKTFLNKTHSEKTKEKMRKTREEKGLNLKEKNSQFGTYWITKNLESKKIKKEELEFYIEQGWKRGRKLCKNKL